MKGEGDEGKDQISFSEIPNAPLDLLKKGCVKAAAGPILSSIHPAVANAVTRAHNCVAPVLGMPNKVYGAVQAKKNLAVAVASLTVTGTAYLYSRKEALKNEAEHRELKAEHRELKAEHLELKAEVCEDKEILGALTRDLAEVNEKQAARDVKLSAMTDYQGHGCCRGSLSPIQPCCC